MGISIPGPAELDMSNLVGWKEGIVDRLNKGVEALLKNAGANSRGLGGVPRRQDRQDR